LNAFFWSFIEARASSDLSFIWIWNITFIIMWPLHNQSYCNISMKNWSNVIIIKYNVFYKYIIYVTTAAINTCCDWFYNKKKSCTFYGVWLFFSSLVNICLRWENIECSPLLVTNVKSKITSLCPTSNNLCTGIYCCCSNI
jgi:hypothetical protein